MKITDKKRIAALTASCLLLASVLLQKMLRRKKMQR